MDSTPSTLAGEIVARLSAGGYMPVNRYIESFMMLMNCMASHMRVPDGAQLWQSTYEACALIVGEAPSSSAVFPPPVPQPHHDADNSGHPGLRRLSYLQYPSLIPPTCIL
jgi:hypothetical protein